MGVVVLGKSRFRTRLDETYSSLNKNVVVKGIFACSSIHRFPLATLKIPKNEGPQLIQ